MVILRNGTTEIVVFEAQLLKFGEISNLTLKQVELSCSFDKISSIFRLNLHAS